MTSRERLYSLQSHISSNKSLDELTKFRNIIDEIERREYVPQDWRDYSCQPSYTKFEIPYYMKCRYRYHRSVQIYEHQFQREIQQIINSLNSAFEAARLVRHLCITTLWPPLHNRSELIDTQAYFFRLTPKERRRLNKIMSTNIQ